MDDYTPTTEEVREAFRTAHLTEDDTPRTRLRHLAEEGPGCAATTTSETTTPHSILTARGPSGEHTGS